MRRRPARTCFASLLHFLCSYIPWPDGMGTCSEPPPLHIHGLYCFIFIFFRVLSYAGIESNHHSHPSQRLPETEHPQPSSPCEGERRKPSLEKVTGHQPRGLLLPHLVADCGHVSIHLRNGVPVGGNHLFQKPPNGSMAVPLAGVEVLRRRGSPLVVGRLVRRRRMRMRRPAASGAALPLGLIARLVRPGVWRLAAVSGGRSGRASRARRGWIRRVLTVSKARRRRAVTRRRRWRG